MTPKSSGCNQIPNVSASCCSPKLARRHRSALQRKHPVRQVSDGREGSNEYKSNGNLQLFNHLPIGSHFHQFKKSFTDIGSLWCIFRNVSVKELVRSNLKMQLFYTVVVAESINELSPSFNHIFLCGDVLLSKEKGNVTNWQTLNENISNEVLAPTAVPMIPLIYDVSACIGMHSTKRSIFKTRNVLFFRKTSIKTGSSPSLNSLSCCLCQKLIEKGHYPEYAPKCSNG